MSLVRPSAPCPDASWWGWGDPAEIPELPEPLRRLLEEGLGVRGGLPEPPAITDLRLPPSRLGGESASALAGAVGEANALDEDRTRILHLRGKSTPDLLRIRAGDVAGVPDLVLLPGSHDQVLSVLRICSERRIAVLPFGGGTSVVGGLEPAADDFAGLVALDLRRMNALVELDEQSRLAVLEPGLRTPQAEALLAERGYTLGHFPQSFEYASLGGFAATRSSGQASAGYGRFDDMVLALRLAAPAGTMTVGRSPKSATGPDLRQLLLGSEGAFGVITALTVQVHPVPERRVYDGWRLPSFAAGIGAARRLAQDGPLPTVVRVSDESETTHDPARFVEPGGSGSPEGCVAILGYEGAGEVVELARAGAGRVLEAAGGSLEPEAGEAWERGRYRGPYLRDALLGAGALVETLETVAFWSALPGVYRAVSSALRDSLTEQGTPPAVLCHISHVYPTGASLYFTVACAQADDPLAQWRAAKAAAGQAILAAGASITHHHGVGTDHRTFYEREIGELAIRTLRAVKAELDPAGIMNPGVLIPRG